MPFSVPCFRWDKIAKSDGQTLLTKAMSETTKAPNINLELHVVGAIRFCYFIPTETRLNGRYPNPPACIPPAAKSTIPDRRPSSILLKTHSPKTIDFWL